MVVLSTGTELVEPGERDLEPGEIYDSNSFALIAQAEEIGARARRITAASDDAAVLRNAVREALETADVVVTSGGVSVGEKDLVKGTMLELGVEQVFWGVKFKPGKPLFFGVRGGASVFGLPGNPVSAMVCFELFVRPALVRMMGREDREDPGYRCTSRRTSKQLRADARDAGEPRATERLARPVRRGAGIGARVLPHQSRRAGSHRAGVRGVAAGEPWRPSCCARE